jgi:hypothetical protein
MAGTDGLLFIFWARQREEVVVVPEAGKLMFFKVF